MQNKDKNINNLKTTHGEIIGFLDGSDGKESACNAEDLGLIPGLGGSPGEGKGYPLQCSCLGNPRQRSLMGTVHGITESDMIEGLTISHSHIIF